MDETLLSLHISVSLSPHQIVAKVLTLGSTDRNLLDIFCFHFAFYLSIRRIMEGRGGEGGRGSSRWKRDSLVMGICDGVLGGVACLLYGRNIRGLHNGVNVVGSLSVEALYDGVMGSLLLGSTLGRRGLF